MSEEKKKWWQIRIKPETKQKLRQIGVVFSGVLLYLLYNLQPALINVVMKIRLTNFLLLAREEKSNI